MLNKRNNISSLTKQYLTARKPFMKESSYAHYTELAENYIDPYVGQFHFETLDGRATGEYVNKLKTNGRTSGKGGLSDKTIRDVFSLLRSIYYFSAENGLCSSDIKVPRLVLSRPSKMKSQILTNAHLKQLETFLMDNLNPENIGIILCLYTGMRIGEICSLKWSDVDTENGLINVNRTVLRIRNTEAKGKQPKTVIVTGAPKTDSSRRTIPVPNTIRKLLKSESGSMPGDYYVSTCSDKQIEPRRYYEKYKQVLKKSGITVNYTFHALRHTYATRCIEAGIDPKVVSELLGHSSVAITLNRYVHPTMEMKKRCVERLLR